MLNLIARKQARLVSIDGDGRARLLKASPSLSADTIPAGTYPGLGKVETVKTRALWIVNDKQPLPLVYEMTRALFESSEPAVCEPVVPSDVIFANGFDAAP